jgi:hypothetical protein
LQRNRILVVSTDTILGAGVVNILTQAKEFEVIRVDSENQNDLIMALNDFLPAAVIFSENYFNSNNFLLPYLINNYPNLRIITVNADDNWVHAYLTNEFFISQSSDLAEFIRSQQVI